jgi:hypothetical protein
LGKLPHQRLLAITLCIAGGIAGGLVTGIGQSGSAQAGQRPAAARNAIIQNERTAPSEDEFAKPELVLKFINDYRSNPEPHKLPKLVRAMGNLGVFRDIDSAGVHVGFIAGVLGSNPDLTEKLITEMFPMPPEDQVVLIKAIAFSGLGNWKSVLERFVERMPARHGLIHKYLYGDGKTLHDLPLEGSSFVLDAHWGYYFATGSAEPVRRIVSTLQWAADKNDVEKLTIASMAKWTLATNGSRDKDLMDVLKAEMNTQPKPVRRQLTEVIEAAETFEMQKLRKNALASIEELKVKGPQSGRDTVWWGQAGQTALALGCVAAGVMGAGAGVGIPCVLGGALSTAALKYMVPQQ